jgi:hypothetical protein
MRSRSDATAFLVGGLVSGTILLSAGRGDIDAQGDLHRWMGLRTLLSLEAKV